MTNITEEIHGMVESEIKELIFKDAPVDRLVEMDKTIAHAIISHPNYDSMSTSFTDWAWDSI